MHQTETVNVTEIYCRVILQMNSMLMACNVISQCSVMCDYRSEIKML